MNKTIQLIIAALLLLANNSYAQNPVWSVAPNYVTTESNETFSFPQPTPPSGLTPEEQEFYFYHGQSAEHSQNSIRDNEGNLLFFVIDDMVYDGAGYLINQLTNPAAQVKGQVETLIVPDPGNCSRYYIILNGKSGYNSLSENSDIATFYAIVDVDLPNIFGVSGSNYNPNLEFGDRDGQLELFNNSFTALNLLLSFDYSFPTYYCIQISCSELRDDNTRLLCLSYADKLIRFEINENGISIIGSSTIGQTFLAPDEHILQGVCFGEMELVQYNNGYRIAFPILRGFEDVLSYEIYSADINQNGDIITEKSINPNLLGDADAIGGLEFSPNANILYFTIKEFDIPVSSPIRYYNYTTDLVHLFLSESFFDHIEIGLNDKMYFINGQNLAFLTNPNNPSISNWNSGISIAYLPSTVLTETGVQDTYLLPDQIDGMDYTSVVDSVTCCLNSASYDADIYESQTGNWNGFNNPISPGSNILYIQDELLVPAGTNLTIHNMVIKFAPEAKLTIEKSNGSIFPGRLYLYNTTLTVDDRCGESLMWKGVTVQGNQNATSQYSNNGYLSMNQNSKIEHALVGVRAGKESGLSWVGGGGIIRSSNSLFRNNATDVIMNPYNGTTNMSHFISTDFIVNNLLNNQQSSLNDRIMMFGVSSVWFSQCEFKIQDNALVEYPLNSRGNGIFALASKFTVMGSCNVPISYPQVCDEGDITARWLGTAQSDVTPSRFENFQYGIRSYGLGVQDQITIRNTIFKDNRSAVFLNNNDNSTLFKNKFIIASGPASDTYYGAYIQNCTGYTIKRNYFRGTDLQERHCGLWINYSGIDPNEIYLNDFEYLYLGTGVLNQNQDDIHDEIGLELLCGEYIKNEYDIALIGENARMSEYQGDSGNPAGNIFDTYYSGPESNIFVDQLTGVEGFRYYHHQENTYNVKPDYISPPAFPGAPTEVIPYQTIYPFYSRLASCPTFEKKTKMAQKNTVEQEREIINQLESSLQALIDDGSTASFLNIARSTTYSSSNIRIALLQASPFLSDVVLQAVIDRDQPLNQWHLCEILLANSPLSSDVWQTYESQAPLAEYLHTLLLQYQDGTSTYMNQLSQINAERKVKERALKGFVNEVMKDSISINVKEINDLMVDEKLNRKIKVQVSLDDMVGNTAEALALLDDYDAVPTDKWKDVMEIYFSIVANDNVISQDQIADLKTIANSQNQGRFEAQSVLVLYTDQDFEEEINYPDDNKSFNAKPAVKPITKRKPELAGVYPNPAKGEFYITYVLPTEKESASIDIYNLEGKLVRSEDVSNGYGILQLNSQAFEAGIYIFNLQLNGETVATQKFTVVE